jgi:hypothetical protein
MCVCVCVCRAYAHNCTTAQQRCALHATSIDVELNKILAMARFHPRMCMCMCRYIVPFAVRRKKRAKRRRKGITAVLDEFNEAHPNVVVRVERSSGDLLFCEALQDPYPETSDHKEVWMPTAVA